MRECFGDQSVTSTFLPPFFARFRHLVLSLRFESRPLLLICYFHLLSGLLRSFQTVGIRHST